MTDKSKKFPVYIGNGITIDAESNKNGKIKVLDIYKAMKLFYENYPKIISIGMAVDWFFTAQSVNSITDIENFPLMSSSWDTPMIEIDDKKEPCYIVLNSDHAGYCFRDGYIHGIQKATFWIPELIDCFKELEYEDIKILQRHINTLIEGFKPMRKSLPIHKNAVTEKGREYQKLMEEKLNKP